MVALRGFLGGLPPPADVRMCVETGFQTYLGDCLRSFSPPAALRFNRLIGLIRLNCLNGLINCPLRLW
jgi:hypothetical protein